MESRQQRATTALLAILTLLMLGLMARPAHAQTGPYSAEIQRALRGARAGSTLLTSATPSTCTAADLVDTQLWSFTLPPNTLNEDGKTIKITASFALGANANSKTINVRVGGTTVGSRVTTQSGGAAAALGTVIRTGAATETAYGDNSSGTGGAIVSLTSDTTTGIILSAWGQNGVASASDICLKTVTVELLQTNTSNIVTSTGGSIANPLLLPNGTVSFPSLSFAALTNTGIYRPSHDSGTTVGVSIAGTEVGAFVGGGFRLLGTLRFNSTAVDGTDTTGPALLKDAANTLSIENSTNGQTLRLYNTKTDASNYERTDFSWAANAFTIKTTQAGTGTGRSLTLDGSSSLNLSSAGTSRWQVTSSGHLFALADNTYDIGASGANRPKDIYAANNFLSTNVFVGAGTKSKLTSASDGVLMISNNAGTDVGRLQFGGIDNTFPAIKRSGAGIDIRAADDSAYASVAASAFNMSSGGSLALGGVKTIINTAPTISSGFGTTPSVTTSNGTAAFLLNVGTGGTASSGVIGLPAATNSWNCFVTDTTAAANHTGLQTLQTGSTTTTATIESQNSAGAATAWAASTGLRVSCFAQ